MVGFGGVGLVAKVVIELFCNGILDFLDLLGLKVQKIQNAVTKKVQ